MQRHHDFPVDQTQLLPELIYTRQEPPNETRRALGPLPGRRKELKEFSSSRIQVLNKGLALEGEAGTELVGSLVKLLGIKGGTKAKGNTLAEEDVVAEGGDTVVVDLELYA